mmetsp:Transcript_560/g.2185  ORF Transcript_560/g.2185 Transcript_560/m.2185 type:complete len:326 (+) Transcript_560:2087-3064(+)
MRATSPPPTGTATSASSPSTSPGSSTSTDTPGRPSRRRPPPPRRLMKLPGLQPPVVRLRVGVDRVHSASRRNATTFFGPASLHHSKDGAALAVVVAAARRSSHRRAAPAGGHRRGGRPSLVPRAAQRVLRHAARRARGRLVGRRPPHLRRGPRRDDAHVLRARWRRDGLRELGRDAHRDARGAQRGPARADVCAPGQREPERAAARTRGDVVFHRRFGSARDRRRPPPVGPVPRGPRAGLRQVARVVARRRSALRDVGGTIPATAAVSVGDDRPKRRRRAPSAGHRRQVRRRRDRGARRHATYVAPGRAGRRLGPSPLPRRRRRR